MRGVEWISTTGNSCEDASQTGVCDEDEGIVMITVVAKAYWTLWLDRVLLGQDRLAGMQPGLSRA